MSENEFVMVLCRKMRRSMEDSNFHTPGNAATSKKNKLRRKNGISKAASKPESSAAMRCDIDIHADFERNPLTCCPGAYTNVECGTDKLEMALGMQGRA